MESPCINTHWQDANVIFFDAERENLLLEGTAYGGNAIVGEVAIRRRQDGVGRG